MGCIQGKKQSLKKSNCYHQDKINIIEEPQTEVLTSNCQSAWSIKTEKLCVQQLNNQSPAIVITLQTISQIQQEEAQLLYNKKIRQIWEQKKKKKISSQKNQCPAQKLDQEQYYVVEGLSKEYKRQNQISTEVIINC